MRSLIIALLCVPVVACADEAIDPDDPAGSLGDWDWDDEGPSAADQSSDQDQSVDDDWSLAIAPRFQLPFPCDQVWAGQTRTGHSPQNAVDFNRSNDEGDRVVA